jgi:hypothetical protein
MFANFVVVSSLTPSDFHFFETLKSLLETQDIFNEFYYAIISEVKNCVQLALTHK